MTLFLRALILGYGTAILVAAWLSAAGLGFWAAGLVAWIGGSVLALAFTAIGAWAWPVKPARVSSFTVGEAEFRLWDDDLMRELIAADLRHDRAQAAKPATAPATAPATSAGTSAGASTGTKADRDSRAAG